MATVETKERPILFSDAMVRAILAGRKTQTRRVIKPQPPTDIDARHGYEFRKRAPYNLECYETGSFAGFGFDCDEDGTQIRCPYGAPGDRLWVRECWAMQGWCSKSGLRCAAECEPDDMGSVAVFYRADGENQGRTGNRIDIPAKLVLGHMGWRPSIHMPRWASRLLLEVKSVRVERVQEITGSEAAKEGIDVGLLEGTMCASDLRRRDFSQLWDSINGTRAGCAWADNPWVWVVEFEQVQERA